VGDFDGDTKLEIAASTKTWEEVGAISENAVQFFDGESLSLKKQIITTDPISDILTAPGPAGRDNLLLATYLDVSLYWASSVNHVSMVDTINGAEIWRSPALLGQIQRNSMSLIDTTGDGVPELILGTSMAMLTTR
jgi:hypothetical protein